MVISPLNQVDHYNLLMLRGKFYGCALMKRFFLSVLLSSMVGTLISAVTYSADILVRSLKSKGVALDDADIKAKAVFYFVPLLFFIASLIYVVPVSAFLIARLPFGRIINKIVSAAIVATPITILIGFLIYVPKIDGIFYTICVIGLVVWLPLFSSSLVSSCYSGNSKDVDINGRNQKGQGIKSESKGSE